MDSDHLSSTVSTPTRVREDVETLLPCPFCGERLTQIGEWIDEPIEDRYYTHPDNACPLTCMEFDGVSNWNRRAVLRRPEGEPLTVTAMRESIGQLTLHKQPQEVVIAHIDTLRTALEEARRERDEAIRSSDAVCDSYAKENQRLHDRAAAAEASLSAARNGALEEAAKAVEDFKTGGSEPETVVYWGKALAQIIRSLKTPPSQSGEGKG